ncbi:MAG: hypothetical protein V9H26_08615 [Verrucomicrobiota bacterium]
MKTFVSHCPQVTIFNMSLALIAFETYHDSRPRQAAKTTRSAAAAKPVALLVMVSSRHVKVENRRQLD